MERGDTGLGRDAYGPPRREWDRRGYGPGAYPAEYGEDDPAGAGRPVDVEEDDYGQLLRRPGEVPPRQQRLRQPGSPHPGQPGRFPPGGTPNSGGPGNSMPHGPAPHGPASHGIPPGIGVPHGGYPDGGMPHGPMPPSAPPNGGMPHAGPPNGGVPHSGPADGGPRPNGGPLSGPADGGPRPNGGPLSGSQMPGRQYRRPNGRRVPSAADRLYRPPGPTAPGGTPGRRHGPGPAAQDPYASSRGRPSPAPAPGGPVPGGPVPGGPVPGGPVPGGPASGPAHGGPRPYGSPGISGVSGTAPPREHPPAAPRYDGPEGRERFGPPQEPPAPPGPVIRQRETAVPEDRPGGPAQPVTSIAPDDLEAFARDLRALRAKANLEYPEMAEVSHYEMKTLAAAAGGLRLPTLPVAVAFVRACDGNVAEWEERWQKLADKITADAARKRRSDGEENAEPLEPADAPAPEPPVRKPAASQPSDSDGGGEVYVITSARPRQPGWQ